MRRAVILGIAWMALLGIGVAQMDAPKPGPEVKKLDFLAGTWAVDGDMKANPMGPGGKISETEKCEWMQGGFYLTCHYDYKLGSMGDGVGLAIFGYSVDDKTYTYREFNSWGEFDDSRGTLDGDTWNWTNDQKMGGMTMKGKFTMKVTSPTSYTFAYSMSQDGTKWTTVMDGTASKK